MLRKRKNVMKGQTYPYRIYQGTQPLRSKFLHFDRACVKALALSLNAGPKAIFQVVKVSSGKVKFHARKGLNMVSGHVVK
jgi:hypothetical protein